MIKIRVKLAIAFLIGSLFMAAGGFYAIVFLEELSKTAQDTAVFKNAASDMNLHIQVVNNILTLYSASNAEKLPALKAEYDFSMEHIHYALETLGGREDFGRYILAISGAHAKIMALAEKIIDTRRGKEEKENNFKIIVAGLKDNRHKIIDQTASGSANLKLDIAQMGYKDKKFNFQYQDKVHADEWLVSIKTVKGGLEKERFSGDLPFIDAYYELAGQSILAVSDINDLKLKSGYYLDNISNLGVESNIATTQIIKIVDSELSKTISQGKNNKAIPFAIILFSFFITGIVVFKISRGIAQSTEKLAQVAEKISKGDLETRVDIKSNDELGYLASVFNLMVENIQKTQAKIKEKSGQMEAVISSMGEGLFVLDKNLNIILINKAAEKLLGISAGGAIGKKVRDILSVRENQRELSYEEIPVARMLKTGKTLVIAAKDNYYYRSVSGKAFPVEIVTAPFMKDNRIIGGVIVFRDITLSKKAEEEREFARINLENAFKSVNIERDIAQAEKNKLREILNSIGDAVFAIDKEKKIIIFNPTAEKLAGFRFQEVKGRIYNKYLKFIDESTKEEKTNFIDKALSGNASTLSSGAALISRDKKLISVADSAAPIKDSQGKAIGCIVVFRDVTAQREIERMRSDFISVVSHQLRTPLSAMKWLAEILVSGDVGALKPKQKDLISEIYLGNQGMIDIVNQMLSMSRIESNRLAINPEEINLDVEIKNILKHQKLFLNKKRQKLEFTGLKDKNFKINTDRILLKNIIDNLVGNASKYTPLGGEIKMTISPGGKDYLLFKISDNGIGIPKEEQYKVFKKFFRAKNGMRYEANGTGLGLYITKSILETIKGKIWFESEENKGTVFYFTVPVDVNKTK